MYKREDFRTASMAACLTSKEEDDKKQGELEVVSLKDPAWILG